MKFRNEPNRTVFAYYISLFEGKDVYERDGSLWTILEGPFTDAEILSYEDGDFGKDYPLTIKDIKLIKSSAHCILLDGVAGNVSSVWYDEDDLDFDRAVKVLNDL